MLLFSEPPGQLQKNCTKKLYLSYCQPPSGDIRGYSVAIKGRVPSKEKERKTIEKVSKKLYPVPFNCSELHRAPLPSSVKYIIEYSIWSEQFFYLFFIVICNFKLTFRGQDFHYLSVEKTFFLHC